MNRGPHWYRSVDSYKPDIVVFGLGAHIFGEKRWKDAFNEVIQGMDDYRTKLLNKTSQQIRFVYKTIQPGGCSREISPLSPDETARTFSEYSFQHRYFYGRDMYALARLKQIKWIPFMDMRMLYSRTDSHPSSRSRSNKDCLHLCTPGPLDVAADVFQDLLAHELRIE